MKKISNSISGCPGISPNSGMRSPWHWVYRKRICVRSEHLADASIQLSAWIDGQESTILTFRESYPRMSQEKKHHWISLEESLKGGNHVFCSIHCVDFRFELSRKIRWKHDDKGTPWQVTKSSNLIASRTSMAGARRCSWQVVVSFKWGVSEWVTPKIDSLDWNILFKWVIWIDLGAPPFEETSKWDVTYKKIND